MKTIYIYKGGDGLYLYTSVYIQGWNLMFKSLVNNSLQWARHDTVVLFLGDYEIYMSE